MLEATLNQCIYYYKKVVFLSGFKYPIFTESGGCKNLHIAI